MSGSRPEAEAVTKSIGTVVEGFSTCAFCTSAVTRFWLVFQLKESAAEAEAASIATRIAPSKILVCPREIDAPQKAEKERGCVVRGL